MKNEVAHSALCMGSFESLYCQVYETSFCFPVNRIGKKL